jgi:hypothetical protein
MRVRASLLALAMLAILSVPMSVAAVSTSLIPQKSASSPLRPSSTVSAIYYLHWSCGGITQCASDFDGVNAGIRLGPVTEAVCIAERNAWAADGIIQTWTSGPVGAWCDTNSFKGALAPSSPTTNSGSGTPSVTAKASPVSIGSGGGNVAMQVTVRDASTCTFSSTPVVTGFAGKTKCSSGAIVRTGQLGENSGLARPVTLQVTVANSSSSTTAKATIQQAGSENCAATPQSGIDLAGCNFTNANLTNANLAGANLSGANFTNANLTGATLTNANLSNTILEGSDFTNANMTNTNFAGASLAGTVFNGTNLTGATNLSYSLTSYVYSDSATTCTGGQPGPCPETWSPIKSQRRHLYSFLNT